MLLAFTIIELLSRKRTNQPTNKQTNQRDQKRKHYFFGEGNYQSVKYHHRNPWRAKVSAYFLAGVDTPPFPPHLTYGSIKQ